jgi:hypothetical protein
MFSQMSDLLLRMPVSVMHWCSHHSLDATRTGQKLSTDMTRFFDRFTANLPFRVTQHDVGMLVKHQARPAPAVRDYAKQISLVR